MDMVSGFLSKTLITVGLLSLTSTPSAQPHTLLIKNPVLSQAYVHVVKSDESLGMIAEEAYGDASYWTTIVNDNPIITDPGTIYSGWKLKIRREKPVTVDQLKTVAGESSQNDVIQPVIPETVSSASAAEAIPTPTQQAPVVATQYSASNYDDVYKAAGAKYGVSWQILYGLHLTETGLRNGPIMNHAGSGAQGPLQFMPGTWGAYGVDGDGDGQADINNAVDAIYGAANYLAKHGSLANGLRSYGGNTPGVLAAARSRGFSEN